MCFTPRTSGQNASAFILIYADAANDTPTDFILRFMDKSRRGCAAPRQAPWKKRPYYESHRYLPMMKTTKITKRPSGFTK